MSDDSHKRPAIGKFVSIQIRNIDLGYSVLRKHIMFTNQNMHRFLYWLHKNCFYMKISS